MSVSKKDFIEIAKILATTNTKEDVINSVCKYFKSENSRFNESKFRSYIEKLRS